MHLPPQVNNRLIHFKKQLLLLAKQKIFTVVLLCQLFCISRNTFYKYRRRQLEGNLGYISSAPISHGRKKGEKIVAAVLAAREGFPDYGKRRIARYLNNQGISICANTVQSIPMPATKRAKKRRRNHLTFFSSRLRLQLSSLSKIAEESSPANSYCLTDFCSSLI